MEQPGDQHATALDAGVLQNMLLRTETLEDFLRELAVQAAHDTRHRCGITVRSEDGHTFTAASSDELSRQLDELQYEEGDGPCLEALTSSVPVFVTDMANEPRWGRYPKRAAEIGARSSMSYPLVTGEQAIGALNLYRFEASAPGSAVQAGAAQIAEHAAGALALALRIATHGKMIDNLHVALTSRSMIDQAIGILMAQQRCDADAAFELLRRASQGRNTKLRDVAAAVVAGVAGVEGGPAGPTGPTGR
jgi:GAF domain-containing protein